MDEKNTKRLGLVQKMLEFIEECDGSCDVVRKVLTAASAIRDIRVPPLAVKGSKIPPAVQDDEEECESE